MFSWLKKLLETKEKKRFFAGRNWKEVDILSLDIESTGLDPGKDHVLSIGWVLIRHGAIDMATASCYRVFSENSPAATAHIHGIRDVDKQQGEDLAVVLERLAEAAVSSVLLGHHFSLDAAFLNRLPVPWEQEAPPCYIDTLKLEQKIQNLSGQPARENQFQLYKLRERYGLPEAYQHDALADALASAELFLAMMANRVEEDQMLSVLIADCLNKKQAGK